MSTPTNPLQPMLDEIVGALLADLYYLAVLQALALPDICGALQTEGGRGGPKQYKAWYEKYVWVKFILLDPSDCYSLRCGVMHQGQMLIPGSNYKRVAFFVPKWGAMMQISSADLAHTLAINIIDFCEEMDKGVRKWFDDEHKNPFVQANIPLLFRPRPNDDLMLGRKIIT